MCVTRKKSRERNKGVIGCFEWKNTNLQLDIEMSIGRKCNTNKTVQYK